MQGYVHRVGRTGRAGQSGLALTLFTPADDLFKQELTDALAAQQPKNGTDAAAAAGDGSSSDESDDDSDNDDGRAAKRKADEVLVRNAEWYLQYSYARSF